MLSISATAVWVYLYQFFMELFSKSTQNNSRRTCAKTQFNVKWPFKVTHIIFEISDMRRGTK